MVWYDLDSIDNRDESKIVRVLERLDPFMERWFRPDVSGVERVPAAPALYVANHNSATLTPDSFVLCRELYRAHGIDALPYGLGHEVSLMVPFFHQLLVPMGAVRASHHNAHRLFSNGRNVLVYPGGDIDSMRAFRDRDRVVFGRRRGYIRLALREGVPIVPVVTAGAHSTLITLDDGRWLARLLGLKYIFRTEVWPISLTIPWGVTVGPPPPYIPLPTRFFMEFLEPIHFDREGEEAASDNPYVEACHARVHGAMQEALTRLAAARRADRRRRVERRLGRSLPSIW